VIGIGITCESYHPSAMARGALFQLLVAFVGEGSVTKMRPVREPLFRLAYSGVVVEEAAAQLRPVIAKEPSAARRTRAYLNRICPDEGYVAHHALEILNAALGLPAPPATADEHELFERERALASKSLAAAFDELAELVPALKNIRDAARETAEGRSRSDSEPRARLQERTRGLVGPESRQPDRLVRSRIAQTIVARYLSALQGDPRCSLDEPLLGARLAP
jgi:hypothetical protein